MIEKLLPPKLPAMYKRTVGHLDNNSQENQDLSQRSQTTLDPKLQATESDLFNLILSDIFISEWILSLILLAGTMRVR